jgi:cytochrome c
LQAFVERRRTSNIMFNVGHVLSPAMIEAPTTDFNQLNPKPVGGAPKENIDEGKNIFENGVAQANVPPCASCHGPQGKGNGPFPRLAGQLYDYITNKLTNWDKERGQNPSQPHLGGDAADCAQFDPTANQSGRRVSELSGVDPCAPTKQHKRDLRGPPIGN